MSNLPFQTRSLNPNINTQMELYKLYKEKYCGGSSFLTSSLKERQMNVLQTSFMLRLNLYNSYVFRVSHSFTE